MERLEEIKGFIIYNEDAPKPTAEAVKDDAKPEDGSVEDQTEQTKVTAVKMRTEDEEIIEKFQNKTLKDFIPCFILSQFSNEKHLDYPDFDVCVDEYFS